MNKSKKNLISWVVFFFLLYIILSLKFLTLKQVQGSLFFEWYSIAVSVYLLSRFALAFLHSPDKESFDKDFEPTVCFGIPAKNEEKNIYKTLVKIAESDYPRKKINIITVNDGSSDNTLAEMERAQVTLREKGIRLQIVDWDKNRGKRAGMAECIRQSDSEIMVFIDSDSFVEPSTLRELVKYFSNEEIGAVTGHTYVANPDVNILTKMQTVRYFVSFKAFKAAESLFGLVTCCSGCCSAYRREHLLLYLDRWVNQTFWGAKCTYGDDRSLTNLLISHGHLAVLSPDAKASTIVPENFRQFMKQQLRWKKSWTREQYNASKFMWRKNPIMSISFYLSFILPLIAPIVLIRAIFFYPIERGEIPYFYLAGLLLMALIYGVYYNAYTKDNKWFYGAVSIFFYSFILIWQLPYAILTLKDNRWGTR